MLRATTDAPTPTSPQPESKALEARLATIELRLQALYDRSYQASGLPNVERPDLIESARSAAQVELRDVYARAFTDGLRHQHLQAELALTDDVAKLLTECAVEAADQHACRQLRSRAPEILARRVPGVRLEQFVDDDPSIPDSEWSTAGYVLSLRWDYDRPGSRPGDAEALALVVRPTKGPSR
ncbi:MAG: hypothetical protein WBM50_15410 [Acidimicrobiales bacterium]